MSGSCDASAANSQKQLPTSISLAFEGRVSEICLEGEAPSLCLGRTQPSSGVACAESPRRRRRDGAQWDQCR